MSIAKPKNIEKYKGQFNNQESKTIPDQTMSLREILTRYAKGLPIDGQKTPIWEGEEGFDVDPKTLDLAEIEELRDKAETEMKDIEQRIIVEKEEFIAKKKKKQETTDKTKGNDPI